MPTDPYTPPASSPWDTDSPQEKIWQTTTSAREIVKGWEKLRIYFNAALLLLSPVPTAQPMPAPS